MVVYRSTEQISTNSVIFVAVRIARALVGVRAHHTSMRLRVLASSQLSQQITSILTYILHVSCIRPSSMRAIKNIVFSILINERVYFCCLCADNWQYACLTRGHVMTHERQVYKLECVSRIETTDASDIRADHIN